MPIDPVDLREIDKQAANVYEAIIVAAKKARIINDDRKIEFSNQLSLVPQAATNADDDSEDFNNPQQVKLSLEFEKRPKPHIDALQQLLTGDVNFEYRSKGQ